MTILIADDYAPIRKSLRRMLESLSGVTAIVEAADGYEAVAYIRNLRPDVVILDIQMPGKTGLEILQDAALKLSNSTIIVLTNYTDNGHREQSQKLGADYFFDKSTEFEKIVDVVEQLV